MSKEKKTRELLLYLYMVYATAFTMCFANFVFASLGTILGLIAIIITYNKRKTAKDTIYESHFTWLIRTFWVGGSLLLPIATILFTILIVALTDLIPMLQDAVNAGETNAAKITSEYAAKNWSKIRLFQFITILPILIWWIARCIKGARLAFKSKEIEKPKAFI